MLHEMRTKGGNLEQEEILWMAFMDVPLSESKRICVEFGCMK